MYIIHVYYVYHYYYIYIYIYIEREREYSSRLAEGLRRQVWRRALHTHLYTCPRTYRYMHIHYIYIYIYTYIHTHIPILHASGTGACFAHVPFSIAPCRFPCVSGETTNAGVVNGGCSESKVFPPIGKHVHDPTCLKQTNVLFKVHDPHRFATPQFAIPPFVFSRVSLVCRASTTFAEAGMANNNKQ